MKYPLPEVGDRIWMFKTMPDDPDPIKYGSTGTVRNVVDLGNGHHQVWMDWDNGRNLALLLPKDRWEHLTDRNKLVASLYGYGGLTLQQIADRIGVSRQRVQQILVAQGVERRPTGPRKKVLTISS